MEYITRDEFEKTIASYEKLGTSEKYVGKMDKELRAYQKGLIDALELKSSQLIDVKIASLNDKIVSVIKASESNIRNNIMKEVDEILTKSKSHVTESVLATVYKSLKDIALQTEQTVNSQMNVAKTKFHHDVEEVSKELNLSVANKLSLFEHSIQGETRDQINTAINYSSSLFTKTLSGMIADFHFEITNQLADVKKSLGEELNKKVVDKAAIEAKFVEIENEMKSKVQQLISFQIDQARNMMEQTARAEINESLKSLTGNFLGSL